MNLNRVFIVGHLTRSPELRFGQNGTAVARFGVATNSAWTDESGVKREEVEFHNVVVFGRLAETSSEYLRKGQLVLVEGRLRSNSWTSEGVKHTRTDIVAQRLQFGAKRSTDESPSADTEPEVDDIPPVTQDSESPVMDDNIPF
jgi:single-strand DNA-binding protein